jgi:ABC-2 type transport system permease protein
VVRERVREIYARREILWNLVRKELKVKYTASVLGAVWSLLNPVVFVAVFTFVVKVLGGNIDYYPMFLLSGLLAWNLFNVALSSGAQSVISNANLVKKVYFPREILPLSTVGVALVDFVLQSAVFFVFIVVFVAVSDFRFVPDLLWLYPMAFAALLVLTTGVTFWVSSMNVRYRDVQHLIGLALLVWFWMTPIVYSAGIVHQNVLRYSSGEWLWRLYLLNPVTWVVVGFQRALYGSWDPERNPVPMPVEQLGIGLGVVILASTLLLYVCWRVYFTLSGDFAEEL